MPRREIKRFVIAFAWAMAATTAHDWATAADLKPAPREVLTQYDWTGFYVGGHVGYSRGNAQVTLGDVTSPLSAQGPR
jgi:high affinity Mn2+ porin